MESELLLRQLEAYGVRPQWGDTSVVRDYHYTHSQPQWAEVMAHPDSSPQASGSPLVVRGPPLAPPRRCATCRQFKQHCSCWECSVCACAVGRGTRHHCRKCWRAVCSACWIKFRYVHMLGRPMRVCDRCAVPWGIANLCKREECGLYWGLYLLRRAGEMPSICVAPKCHTYTYYPTCYACGTATVMTQPHMERLVRVDTAQLDVVDKVRVLDAKAASLRDLEVTAMEEHSRSKPNRDKDEDDKGASFVDQCFRDCFQRSEAVTSFRGVLSSVEAQDLLLGLIAATVSYEYHSAPNLTLVLSDVPYARLLRIVRARPRYSIFEAPGRVKLIAFPGTHNWRTRLADINFASEPRQVWAPLHEGVRIDRDTGEPVMLCGGVRKVWEYTVHSGFAQEARDVGLPLEELIEDVRQGYRLVFAGHSLGGAVAQLLAIQMLARYPDDLPMPVGDAAAAAQGGGDRDLADVIASRETGKILCVTLGSPLVGNFQLVERVESSGWAGRFHNIVYRTDVVPRLSCGDELTWDAAAQVLRRFSSFYSSIQSWFPWAGGGGGASDANRDEYPYPDGGGDHSGAPPTHPAQAATAAVTTAAGVAGSALGALASAVGSADSGSGSGGSGAPVVGGGTHVQFSLNQRRTGGGGKATLERFVDSSIRHGRDMIDGAVAATVDAATLPAASGGHTSRPSNATNSNNSASESDEDGDVSALVEQIAKGQATSAANRLHRRFTCFGRYHFLSFGRHGYVSTADSELIFGILKRGCGDATVLLDHSTAAYNRAVMLHLYCYKKP